MENYPLIIPVTLLIWSTTDIFFHLHTQASPLNLICPPWPDSLWKQCKLGSTFVCSEFSSECFEQIVLSKSFSMSHTNKGKLFYSIAYYDQRQPL